MAARTALSYSPLGSRSILHCEMPMTRETGEAFPGKVALEPTPESCVEKLDFCRQRVRATQLHIWHDSHTLTERILTSIL